MERWIISFFPPPKGSQYFVANIETHINKKVACFLCRWLLPQCGKLNFEGKQGCCILLPCVGKQQKNESVLLCSGVDMWEGS